MKNVPEPTKAKVRRIEDIRERLCFFKQPRSLQPTDTTKIVNERGVSTTTQTYVLARLMELAPKDIDGHLF